MKKNATILDRIISDKQQEVAANKSDTPLSELQKRIGSDRHSLLHKMHNTNAFHFICEIKKASPSRGLIRSDFNPSALARDYTSNGAAALSVLTDTRYFMGHLDHLRQVRTSTDIPLLRKDFIIDPYQIYESKAAGADIILLIARCLSAAQIKDFCAIATELNLEVLLEIAAQDEVDKIPADRENLLLGVNSRNLHTFKTDLQFTKRLRKLLPSDLPVIGESGIQTVDDCLNLRTWGYSGALIGETFMRAKEPGKLLKKFRETMSVA